MKKAIGIFAGATVVVLALLLWLGRSQSTGRGAVQGEALASQSSSAERPSPTVSSGSAGGEPVALSVRGTKTVRVAAAETITATVRRQLAARGVRVIAPISAREVVAEATPSACRSLKSAKGSFTVEDVVPNGKIQQHLADICKQTPTGEIPVAVIGLAESDRSVIESWVAANGGTVTHSPHGPDVLCASVSRDLVTSLSERGDVRWIEYAPPMKLFNDLTAAAGAANVDVVRTDYGLTGKGTVVTVCDSGFDNGTTNSCHADFAGRVRRLLQVGGTVEDKNGHGTHVAGTVLGNGKRSGGLYKGMAPEAELVAVTCGDTAGSGGIHFGNETYATVFTKGLPYDSFIHSDSWGSDAKGYYTMPCRDLDDVMWKNPELLIVMAAGNDGENGAMTVGAPAAAKNALTVGNGMSTRPTKGSWGPEDDPNNLNGTSSRGPTRDGRIKPEITAPGTAVRSTRSSSSSLERVSEKKPGYYYTEMTGTSMATPLVSGAAALVRQWLVERRNYEGKPTGALIKAILTGGTVMMTGVGAEMKEGKWATFDLAQKCPNADTGWGRLDLGETLYPTNGRSVKFADRIPFANGQSYVIDVTTTNEAPLDVQLAWTDYYADPSADGSAYSASRTLINDLDLIVSNKTTGVVAYGNDMDGGDRTNTVESVRLPIAEAGEYAVIVRGTSVSYASTEGGAAAVYVRGALAEEAIPAKKEYVRIAGKGTYETLDEALLAATDGDKIEILLPTTLEKPVTVNVNCMIVATNADPSASAVLRAEGASLVVGVGKGLALSNVVFGPSRETLVTVYEGGRLALSGMVDFGVPSTVAAVSVHGTDGLVLAGPISCGFTLDCGPSIEAGKPFGLAIWNDVSTTNSAAKIANFSDKNGEQRGVVQLADDQVRLVWADIPVPMEESIGYFVTEDGEVTNTAARLDRLIEQFEQTPDVGEIVVRAMPDLTLNRKLTVSRDLTIRGEGDAVVSGIGADAGFVVEAGTLTMEDLTLEGYDGDDAVLTVDGGSLVLKSGVTVRNAIGRGSTSGALFVRSGTATVDGAVFENCANKGDDMAAGGGAITVGGAGCRLVLNGGSITGCSSLKYGGGVYAFDGSEILIGGTGGKLTVRDNIGYGANSLGVADDIFIRNDSVSFLLADEGLRANGSVGVRRGTKEEGNRSGDAFIAVSAPSQAAVADSCAALFSDADPDLTVALAADGKALVWADPKVVDNSLNKDDVRAAVRIVRAGSSVDGKYYERLEHALDVLTADGDTAATLEILKDMTFRNDLSIDFALTVSSTGSVPFSVMRENDVQVLVGQTGSLLLTNVVFVGGNGKVGLIDVKGGSMVMESGAKITGVDGSANRASGAVSVWNGGSFTLNDGASIVNCQNMYSNVGAVTGCGAALLVEDGSVAYLRGGLIGNCVAAGAAVSVNNGSKLFVSGTTTVKGNVDLGLKKAANVCVSEDSELLVDDKLTGFVGYRTGIRSAAGDPNVFGLAISSDGFTESDVANAARCFVNDSTRDYGQAVSNTVAGQYLLVWGSAIENGAYKGHAYVGAGTLVEIAKPVANDFVYDGNEKIGVRDGVGYVVTGNRATSVGDYTADVVLRDGFSWEDGSRSAIQLTWKISKGVYDLSPLFATDYVYDGTEKFVVLTNTLPDGVSMSFVGNDLGRRESGSTEIIVVFEAADTENLELPFASTNLTLTIHKAAYDMSAVVFPDETFMYDGTAKYLSVVEATLPDGVSLVKYDGNGNVTSGVYTVTAKFAGDEKNHLPVDDLTAIMTIYRNPDMVEMSPEPEPEVITPTPIAIKSVTRVNEAEWALVITNRVPYCNYRILWTDNLAKGFTATGDWEQAAADAPAEWTTNILFAAPAPASIYWRAEGKEGLKPAGK